MSVYEFEKDKFVVKDSNPMKRPNVEKEGDGFISALSSIGKTIMNNKDLISNVAKGAAAIGSTASNIAEAVKTSKELDTIREIQAMKEKALKQNKKSISEDMKKKIANMK